VRRRPSAPGGSSRPSHGSNARSGAS